MGACVGAVRSPSLAVATVRDTCRLHVHSEIELPQVAGGVVAGWWHSYLRCVSQPSLQALSELDLVQIVRDRVSITLRCAGIAAVYSRLFAQAPLLVGLVIAWHAAFAVDVLVTLSSCLLEACLLEPLNYDIIAGRSPSSQPLRATALLLCVHNM